MNIKIYKPTTSSRRMMTNVIHKSFNKSKSPKKLIKGKKSISGRGNNGRINMRFRGGGHKKKLRTIDFNRNKLGILAKIINIEYDPNRNAKIALLQYIDGVKKYIISPKNIKLNDTVISDKNTPIKLGNNLQLNYIPLGSHIHNIELKPGKGGQLVRAAGTYAQLMSKEKSYATIKMPSSEIRMVHLKCCATLGQVGNDKHELIKLGKAGRSRWLGKKPHNRGVSMNPIDHPLGGGEGKSSGGRHPSSPWGVYTKGHRTRNNKRTQQMIIKRRKS